MATPIPTSARNNASSRSSHVSSVMPRRRRTPAKAPAKVARARAIRSRSVAGGTTTSGSTVIGGSSVSGSSTAVGAPGCGGAGRGATGGADVASIERWARRRLMTSTAIPNSTTSPMRTR